MSWVVCRNPYDGTHGWDNGQGRQSTCCDCGVAMCPIEAIGSLQCQACRKRDGYPSWSLTRTLSRRGTELIGRPSRNAVMLGGAAEGTG